VRQAVAGFAVVSRPQNADWTFRRVRRCFSVGFLVDRTAHSMIGYWHDTAVCLSVCL